MDDQQMEKLIAGIRESENKNQSLSETLMAFNESFTRFMAQIEAVGKLREFEESHEKIVSLEEHIAGIKEDIELINTAQMVRLNELGREIEGQMKKEFKEALKSELKEEMMKGFEKLLDKKLAEIDRQQGKKSLRLKERLYVVDASGKAVWMKQAAPGLKAKADETLDEIFDEAEGIKVYEGEEFITGIAAAKDNMAADRVIVCLENGEMHIL